MSDEQLSALEAEPSDPVPPHGQRLGLWDAVSVIIGIVIGAGIYETAPIVFSSVASPAQAMGVWVLGGVLSLIGAFCYAELGSAYPRSGGDYVYLTRAYSPFVGFLFGWAQLAVITTGSIGMLAYVFADYAAPLFRLGERGTTILAALSVLALTIFNFFGVVVGKTAQNVLSWLKLVGIAAVIVAGFALGAGGEWSLRAAPRARDASLGLAMVLVLYTYGGWNDAAFVAAEVRNRRRNLPRALVLGTLAITSIYLLMNLAFLWGLGLDSASASRAIAADLLAPVLGDVGRRGVSVLVMISALSAINALIFTGSRVHASLGADHRLFAALGRWHPRFGSPVASLGAQLAITLSMIFVVGTRAGRGLVDAGLVALGLSRASWSGHGGFDTLLRCTAPVFWSFFLLTGVSLFVLRVREPSVARPFRVPLYPLFPLVFCATCLYMLYSSIVYAGMLSALGALPVLLGAPLYLWSRREGTRLPSHTGPSDPLASNAE